MDQIQVKSSSLNSALRRIGGQMGEVIDIEGEFIPDKVQSRKDRVYGLFQTHDAKVRISFDQNRITLPQLQTCNMVVSGKMWMDIASSKITLMVRYFKVVDSVQATIR